MTYNPGFPNAPINYDHQNESAFRSMVQRALNDVGGTIVLEGAVGELYEGEFGDTLINDGNEFVASTKFLVDMQFQAKIQFCDPITGDIQNEFFQETADDGGGFGGGGSGSGLVSQTTSGKLIRRGDTDFLSTPGDEWDLSEWTSFGGSTLSIEGTGKLQISGVETDEWHGGLFNALAARNKQMIQAIVFFGTGGTSNSYLGVGAIGTVAGGTPSFDGYASVKQAGPTAGDDRFTLFRIGSGATSETKEIENDHDQSPGTGWRQVAFHDHSPVAEADRKFTAFCGPNDLLGNGQTELDLSTVTSGQVAFIQGKTGTAGLSRMTKMFVSADGVITVQNLPVGYKAKLFDSGDTLLREATAISGVATISVVDIWCEDISYLRVDNGSDVEQARFTIVNEVMYGGSVYDYNEATLPSGSVRETATGVKKAFMDFQQYNEGAGLPSDWRHIGDGSPTFSIGNDPTEGNYLEISGHDTTERAIIFTPWDGMLGQEAEFLARVYVNAAVANRRIGGPGFLIWGTSSSDLNAQAGGMYMRATDDFESNVLEYEGGTGTVEASADLQEAEQTGVWMWIRWRRDNYNTAPIPDQADYKVKAWFGDLADEPAGWDAEISADPQGIEVTASGIGWFLADLAYTGVQRISYLSWTSDPSDGPDEPAALPSAGKWAVLQNPLDDSTRLQIKARTDVFTEPLTAALSLVREQTGGEHMTLLLRNSGAADEYQLHFEKEGTGAVYLPFHIRWDATSALTLLSPDDVGGPEWQFAVAVTMADTLGVTGLATLGSVSVTGTSTFVGNADFQALVQLDDGLESAPSLHFSDVDTGFFATTAPRIGVAINGNEVLGINRSGGPSPLVTITGTTSDVVEELLALRETGTGDPFLAFYQSTTSLVGYLGFWNARNALEVQSRKLGSNFNVWTRTAGGSFIHVAQFQPDGAPHLYLNPASATGDEILRLRGTSAGSPLISFYQTTTERAYIQYLNASSFRITNKYGPIRLNPGTGGTASQVLYIPDAGAVILQNSVDELFRLVHTSATGSPYLSFYQSGTRRSYIRHRDSGDTLQMVSEFGNVTLNPGSLGTQDSRVVVSDSEPHVKLRGKSGSTEIFRLEAGGVADDLLVSFFQTTTRRAYIQYGDASDIFRMTNEYGDVAFSTGTAGTESERLRVSEAGPHVHIKGKTAVDELLRVDHADAAGSPIASFRQATTERARLQWVDADTDFLIEAFEAASRINLVAPAGVHITDDLELDGDFNHDGTNIGFFTTTPAAQQTVTGSRGGNAALASLLTGLANYGLIVDSTTA